MYKDIKDAWNMTLKIIKTETSSPISYTTWIEPLQPYAIEENNFILQAEKPFYKEMVEQKYIPLIKNAVKQVTKIDYEIKIITAEDIKKGNIQVEKTSGTPKYTYAANNLNPKYVFSTFVVGNSNRMAHAAALAVAESPAKAYNPLFLYGDVGLGKTHLMHSIAHYILERDYTAKVLYASSETFTNELINSIRNNKNEEFRDKYRNIDVLLIDDIQFIAQKEGTQEEFFHTFNALHGSNKQIIISSDRPPKEIRTLEDRLRSRFECGLIADIQPPDLETRIAILSKKAETDNIDISNEVLNFIAASIISNIRELEGALNRISALSNLLNMNITIDLAKKAIKDIFNEKNTKEISVEYIQEVVADYYNITPNDIKGIKKPKKIAYPRQIAMYLSRKLLDISLPKIGEKFGGRDHTTVMHACNKIEKDIEKSSSIKTDIIELEKRIRGQ